MINAERALTLWPEWLVAFRHLGKRVENRSWAPPPDLIGKRIALHAGASIGGGSFRRARWMEDTARANGWLLRILRKPHPAVWWRPLAGGPGGVEPIVSGAVVCTARLVSARALAGEPWAIPGQVHWLLDEFHWLEKSVPMRGKQGLWRLP